MGRKTNFTGWHPALFASEGMMKADEHEEIAKAVEMCRENGWERAAFILARAWHEEIHKARKAKRKPVDDDKED